MATNPPTDDEDQKFTLGYMRRHQPFSADALPKEYYPACQKKDSGFPDFVYGFPVPWIESAEKTFGRLRELAALAEGGATNASKERPMKALCKYLRESVGGSFPDYIMPMDVDAGDDIYMVLAVYHSRFAKRKPGLPAWAKKLGEIGTEVFGELGWKTEPGWYLGLDTLCEPDDKDYAESDSDY